MSALPSPGPVSPYILLGMTATTGIVDAVSLLALGHVFTANMTGNVLFLGFALAGAQGFSIPRSSMALIAFLLGAGAAGRLATRMTSRPLHYWTSGAFCIDRFLFGVPDLTTTVLTLTITGLAADSSLAGGANPQWRRRVASVLLMFAGAAVGGVILKRSVAAALCLCGIASAACAVSPSSWRRFTERPTGAQELKDLGQPLWR
jgi:uncharacterized membrane protein YoaK (UPF0700 family)